MSLATKYRPKTLNEIVEQHNIVETIYKKYKANTIPHAILLVGKSGAGKSTLAYIIANMLRGYTIELDVASHNGVEEMRQLLSDIRTKPLGYDNTIVILDEVHAGSSAFFQTLLLSLEKPPAHVYFILCTTEQNKIIPTIKSRCEEYVLMPISTSGITERLIAICKAEGFKYEDNAIHYIAEYSNGSMRQAISNLERLCNNDITVSNVTTNLIQATYGIFINIIYNYGGNTEELLNQVNRINDYDKFIQSFFSFLLDLSIYFKTNKFSLTTLPELLYNIIMKLDDTDKKSVQELLPKMYKLQFEGKNSPILRELFIANVISKGE